MYQLHKIPGQSVKCPARDQSIATDVSRL